MGTVNYRTSDYITVGLEPYAYDMYTDENGKTDYDARDSDMYWDMEHIKELLSRYTFNYFHVVIVPGYYEGFSIDIENNYSVCYDCWQDKREALKEATRIKQFLLECVEACCCVCSPGWCTSYKGYSDSIQAVKKAIRVIKEEIKNTPTWLYCERMGIEV